MPAERLSHFAFTKLVVADLDAMADFYCGVFDLHRARRARFESGVGDETIEEVNLAASPDDPWGSLILLRYEDRAPPKDDEVILGFTTSDLQALLDRFLAAGGSLVSDIQEFPDHGLRVAFARDPEGHVSELVEVS